MSIMSLARMTRCLRTSRVLQRCLDGEADDLTTARVTEHLEECRRCGLQARAYQAIKQALRSGSRDVDDLTLHRLRAFSRSLSEREDPDAG